MILDSIFYNRKWDKQLNYLLDNDKLEVETYCTVVFYKSDITVWIESYPYCFGNPHNFTINIYPSRKTKRRLRKAILNIQQKTLDKKLEKITGYEN